MASYSSSAIYIRNVINFIQSNTNSFRVNCSTYPELRKNIHLAWILTVKNLKRWLKCYWLSAQGSKPHYVLLIIFHRLDLCYGHNLEIVDLFVWLRSGVRCQWERKTVKGSLWHLGDVLRSRGAGWNVCFGKNFDILYRWISDPLRLYWGPQEFLGLE